MRYKSMQRQQVGGGLGGTVGSGRWGAGRVCRFLLVCLWSVSGMAVTGCVERTIRIDSEPSRAVVWLNDEEVGSTPLEVPFTWYGTYEVVLRKDGYETVRTLRTAEAPVYQWPPFDLAAEHLLPFTLEDRHEWQFTMVPYQESDPNQLLLEAQRLQRELLIAPTNQP